MKKKNENSIILAFETSCDDTSIAIFQWEKLLAMETASQIKLHNITWGVVPELAAREHANTIFDVLTAALKQSEKTLKDVDYIWVTTHPWLLPSLLTGTTVASTISTLLNIPILAINHIQAHIFANFLERKESEIPFPLVCLTVSGGHNDMYYMKNMWDLEKIGSTTDDASGEAFDKVSKMMGLWYPGGPIVSKMADEYKVGGEYKVGVGLKPTPTGIQKKPLFPRVWLIKKEANFSFSWLKSAVKREVDRRVGIAGMLSLHDKKEISYEFQEAVIEVLAYKLIQAAEQKGVQSVLLAWWVSANTRLKKEITHLSDNKKINFLHPVKNVYSMDNAAMVGILTYYMVKYNKYEHTIWCVKL